MMAGLLFCLILFFVSSVSGRRRSANSHQVYDFIATNPELYSQDVQDDADLDVPDLIAKYGYPVEVHNVETSDNYILEVHRIPHGKHDLPGSNRTVVFLMHGLLCSSADWIIMGPEKGLGYILADNGYDVWMGNARGNFYSRRHRSLDPRYAEFWDFSWHEIGIYDTPSMVDYILAQTKRTKIHYVGHSQGTTSFMVMASTRPEYNDKFESVQLMAPAILMTNAFSPLLRLIAPLSGTVGAVAPLIGWGEFLPYSNITKRLGKIICKDESFLQTVCSNALFALCGFNESQLNKTTLPLILGHTPAGSSAKQLVHYGQGYKWGTFSQFSNGLLKNMAQYWWPFPPKYDLSLVTASVAMHYSDNDWLVSTEDAAEVYRQLKNPIGLFKVPLRQFNHFDFLWAIDVKKFVYELVISIIKKYTHNNLDIDLRSLK